ncbi:4338_t:CDS:2 [Paraglomus brasilianum]|uniref:4338_t:CDS:1 n=1 Tax=Paraglomus brasilianum TaxID=144538 RepID=A0A9N9G9M9_9GLOM|nr:4338_t:CDS:2 [Paraglomus brasilianum]
MASANLQSIADLTTTTHITTGDIPPPLVGASTTTVGTELYLFAGRLVSSRRMTNDLYVLDLTTFVWRKTETKEDETPKARYFHSANPYKKSIIFFGGMGYSKTANDGLCVLDDINIYNTETQSWQNPEIVPSAILPKPRYAHLAAIAGNKLVVVGGQDMTNVYIEEINVYDIEERTWTSSRSFEKHCGAYRSVAISCASHTNLPSFGSNLVDAMSLAHDDQPIFPDPHMSRPLRRSGSQQSIQSSNNSIVSSAMSTSTHGSWGSSVTSGPSGVKLMRSRSIKRNQSTSGSYFRLSYTTTVTAENPNPIYLYSNYNFTDVKRELQVIAPPTTANYQIMDHSANMSGPFLPPGLRFPTGGILGHHIIISGTYLTDGGQTFSIWALNLANLIWTRIDTGSCFMHGSWNRGVMCEAMNKYAVLGHRDRSLVEDYNHRQTNYDHVTLVDLEAFGIYQPPSATMTPIAQELGLALLNEPNLADYEVVTLDKNRISVNSHILSQRWPHFQALVEQQIERVPELKYDNDHPQDSEEKMVAMYKHRVIDFPEPYPVTLAFLQYLYTDNLLTNQQQQPHILAQLLLLADMYQLERLKKLTAHALHQALSMTTAALIYETAALSKETGLQIRALKMMHDPSQFVNPKPTTNNADVRTSYYDAFPQLATSSNASQITGRTRSSSLVSAFSGSSPSLRGVLPAIRDSRTSILSEESQYKLRSTKSTNSLKSIKPNRNIFAISNG